MTCDKVTNSDLDKISKCCISGDLDSLRTIWQLKVVQILGRTLAEKRERDRKESSRILFIRGCQMW